MKKVLSFLLIMPTFIYASYNPFFKDIQTPAQIKKKPKVVYLRAKPKPKRTDIDITYFGYIESKKGKFALISINKKNIVVKQKDSVYLGEQVVKVVKLSSNYIILKDGINTPQTVYFSSKVMDDQNDK